MSKAYTRYEFMDQGSNFVIMTLRNYKTGSGIEYALIEEPAGWDTPVKATRIAFDKPATSGGGSFADPLISRPGKTVAFSFKVVAQSAFSQWLATQTVKSLVGQNFIKVIRTQEFRADGMKVVDSLENAYFVDYTDTEASEANTRLYAFTLTSKDPDTTDPVVTTL